MARAPMLPFGKAPPFTDGDPFSMSRTLRWMVENLRTPQEGTIKENLGGGKYRVETFVAPESFIYCKGCGLTVGQKVILFRPIGGTDIDVETEWLALPTCVNGDDGDSGSGSGDSGDCGSGSGDSGSGSGASGSGCGGSGSGDSGSGEPSGSGSGGSGDGDGDGSGGDGDGDGDGSSGDCGGSGSGSGSDGGVIRPGEDDIGGCCIGGPGLEATANGIIHNGMSPDPCPPEPPFGFESPCCTEASEETTLTFTRDHLCLGGEVPTGQGYWRGPSPIACHGAEPVPADLVLYCDFSEDPTGPPISTARFKAILVDRETGCLIEEGVVHSVSEDCDPFQLVVDFNHQVAGDCGWPTCTGRVTITN